LKSKVCFRSDDTAAIRAALEHGYGVEIDLQLSRDGVAMVFHDDELARLTGQAGRVNAHSAQALADIQLRGGTEGIPDLDEVLALVAGRTPVLIELKDQHGAMGQTDGRLEAATARALAGYTGPVGVMSFNPEMMVNLAQLAPDVPRGLVTCGFPEEDWPMLTPQMRAELSAIPDYDRTQASFLSHQISDLGSPRVGALKAAGADILCWTVRSAQQEAQARRIADNVTFEGYLAEISA
jgi:glycerophosphoryl diester phosphodiesterase